MVVSQLINQSIPALDLLDAVAFALESMEEYRIGQMAIVNNGQYVGLASENILLESPDDRVLLSRLLPQHQDHYCLENQHIYECIGLVQQHQLEVIAVLDESLNYLGTVQTNDLYREFIAMTGNKESGAILVLNLQRRDYSLSEICRLIEQNDIKVISSFYSDSNDEFGQLTLKLNGREISGVVATLERFGYSISATYSSEALQSTERDRLDMLMHYLNI